MSACLIAKSTLSLSLNPVNIKKAEKLYLTLKCLQHYRNGMANNGAVRAGINLTVEDKNILRKLKRQFEKEHGKQTLTGVIRIAIRKAVEAK